MSALSLENKTGPGGAGRKAANGNILPLLTVRQVADHLGLREGTIYEWVAARRLPVVRLGRSVRIPAAAVATLIAENTVPERGDRS